MEAREQIAEAEEVARQQVAELEASLKNKSILLQEAAKFAEKTKQDAQQRIAELEESAERGRSLPQMPGGLPTQADAMRMDMDEGSTGCKFQSFNNIHCVNVHCTAFNNARLGEDHWSLFVSRDGGSTGYKF